MARSLLSIKIGTHLKQHFSVLKMNSFDILYLAFGEHILIQSDDKK